MTKLNSLHMALRTGAVICVIFATLTFFAALRGGSFSDPELVVERKYTNATQFRLASELPFPQGGYTYDTTVSRAFYDAAETGDRLRSPLRGYLKLVRDWRVVARYTQLLLNKTNANALAGTVFLRGGYNSYPQIHWQTNHQIADTSRVIFEDLQSNAGSLYMNNYSDTIGSLEGGPYATIFCNAGQLTVGGNNQDCRYYGFITGSVGATNLTKIGTGLLIISDYQALQGKTIVNGGTLLLSNVFGVHDVRVNSGARLVASGWVGALTASGTGRIEPGLQLGDFSYAKLSPGSLSFSSGIYRCGIGGAVPGTNCDQIETAGPLFISGALELTSYNIPTSTNSYTIINVTNTALTLGAFVGLPEGAEFTSQNGHNFRITYHGGDGNDVVVTRVGPLPPAPQISGITPQADGQMRILATGISGMTYMVQATTNIVPAAWVDLGTTFADGGWLEFIDTDAAKYPVRFYRFVLP